MKKMIANFGAQGIVESRNGVTDDPDFPATIFVENLPDDLKDAFRAAETSLLKATAKTTSGSRMSRVHQAGWTDEQHLKDALNLRARKKPE